MITLLLISVLALDPGELPGSVLVNCPSDALITLDGQPTATTGPSRKFVTVPLNKPVSLKFEFSSSGKQWEKVIEVGPGEDKTLDASPDVSSLFGVEKDKITPGKTTRNGKEISLDTAVAAIRGDGWRPADKDYPFIVVIGSEAERKPVLADLKAMPGIALKWRIQEYSPEEWPVAGVGFVTSGHPTIYLQAASGEVLHRQDTYEGPDKLAEALRKADPSYDSKKDPNLNSPLSLPPNLPIVPLGAAVIVAAIVLFGKRN